MKTKFLNVIFLIGVLTVISTGCANRNSDGVSDESSDGNRTEYPIGCECQFPISCECPMYSSDCPDSDFFSSYTRNFSNSNVFSIIGVVLNSEEHGCNIKVIEDLKGNFCEKTYILVSDGWDNRYDFIKHYTEGDTLIVSLHQKRHSTFCNRFEKYVDFETLPCQRSILKWSNGYVTGYITSSNEIETMPWEELRKDLQTFINLNEKPTWFNSTYCAPLSFYHTYKKYGHFFIQGLILESHEEYGKKIKLLKDFTGHFPEDDQIFIAWGSDKISWDERLDNLRMYNEQDTLLMVLAPKTSFTSDGKMDYIHGEYNTFSCAFSVLKLSNGIVCGYITSCYKGEQYMPWEEFQILLN